MSRLLTAILVALIRLYRLTGPIRPSFCRFSPTCSRYAWQAIVVYGPWRGSWKAIRRILRCQPYCHGGLDPL